jgi:hypothetical protein
VTVAQRPSVDVVVPFFGSDAALEELRARMATIRLLPGDTLTIVDNRPWAALDPGLPDVIGAPEVQSSYHARNRGVARGRAPWIVFLDADVDVTPEVVEQYFATPPAPETGMLEGVVVTPPVRGRVARYGVLCGHVGNENVSVEGHEYVQTANAAYRREAFEAAGGFPTDIRSGGDADLSFRVRDLGWAREARPEAVVGHPPRARLKPMVRVYARYGSGAEWLAQRYPTFSPPVPLWRLARSLITMPAAVVVRRVRSGPDAALVRALDPVVYLAFELGRFLPNEANAGHAAKLRHAVGVLRRRVRGAAGSSSGR